MGEGSYFLIYKDKRMGPTVLSMTYAETQDFLQEGPLKVKESISSEDLAYLRVSEFPAEWGGRYLLIKGVVIEPRKVDEWDID